jgi:hypothetical protein
MRLLRWKKIRMQHLESFPGRAAILENGRKRLSLPSLPGKCCEGFRAGAMRSSPIPYPAPPPSPTPNLQHHKKQSTPDSNPHTLFYPRNPPTLHPPPSPPPHSPQPHSLPGTPSKASELLVRSQEPAQALNKPPVFAKHAIA